MEAEFQDLNIFKKQTKRSVTDHTIHATWKKIDLVLIAPRMRRNLCLLNKELMAPPYGVKAGLLPIFYIAAYMVYQHELAIYENRLYARELTMKCCQFIKRLDEFTFQRFRIEGLKACI